MLLPYRSTISAFCNASILRNTVADEPRLYLDITAVDVIPLSPFSIRAMSVLRCLCQWLKLMYKPPFIVLYDGVYGVLYMLII
jgi:hypothetical protein